MKLFVIVLAFYFGIDAIITFVKETRMGNKNRFSTIALLKIELSIGLAIWAIVLLLK